ncbi:MAG TPA: AAA family ATPase, partial [Treponemataceae bacterium]|nr:AAA family ATPase [Treponemataceae bacterium]
MTHTEKELTVGQIAFAVSEERIKKLRLEGRKNPLIGQQRAIEALELGLGIRADGYNIFIMGASGTGRRTVLTSLLAEYKANTSELQDIAYVYNFTKPLEPKALFFPPGTGAYFAKNLKSAIESIRRQALQITKSEVFAASRKRVISRSETDENQVLAEFET